MSRPHRKRRLATRHRPASEPGERICLACDHAFMSEGPWNRICPACSDRHEKQPASHREATRHSLRLRERE